ncbi:hypothetical protein J7J81_00065 [bacterium]|nr:hypothetical protein [bacterium]
MKSLSLKKSRIKKILLREINLLKDKRGFLKAGLPRYNRLFGRDSLISAWELLDFDSNIARNTLKILSKYQGKKTKQGSEEEPGKILHEVKKFFPWNYYGSVDSTPLFLILFYFYFKATADEKFLKKHWVNVLSALNWIYNYGDRDGDLFLEYKRKTRIELFHQGWKDGFENHLKIAPPVAIVEAQGYQYLALVGIAQLAGEVFNDKKLKNSLNHRAESLKEKFNKKFWMKSKKYFALALDGQKKQRKAIASNPGHLLFTGICKKEKEKLVVRRLFQEDLWTPYGIRTHSALEPDFNPRSYHLGSIWPHDNWIIAQGLRRLGYKKEYHKVKTALFRAVEKFGFVPELYAVEKGKLVQYPGSCHPQAWASGALLSFLEDNY